MILVTKKRLEVVLMIGDICEFSDSVALRSKAQCEGNGHFLVEHCNAAAKCYRVALWVSLSTCTDFVVPLDKGATIACEARLAVNVDKLTESTYITYHEHIS